MKKKYQVWRYTLERGQFRTNRVLLGEHDCGMDAHYHANEAETECFDPDKHELYRWEVVEVNA